MPSNDHCFFKGRKNVFQIYFLLVRFTVVTGGNVAKWFRALRPLKPEVLGSRSPPCHRRNLFLGGPELKSSVTLFK